MLKKDPNVCFAFCTGCNAVGGAGRQRLPNSDSRPNYAVLGSLLAGLLFTASSMAQATIINAASASLTDVRRAMASAAHGDTVIIPAGTAAWTSGLTITKSITIQGQTTVNSDNGTSNDQTILVDNLIHVPGDQGFFHCTTNAGQSLRITGITFTGEGGRSNGTYYNGAVRFYGTSNQVRIDHCHFTNLYHSNYIAAYSTIYGVADHLVLDNMPSQQGQQRVFNGTGYGDLEFSQPANYGSGNFFFFEDNYINNTGGPFSAQGGNDAGWGGRFVVRHCHLFDVEILCHGTELDRHRGGRAQEIYNNDYHWSYTTHMDGIRSGSLIVHDNTYVGNLPYGYSLQTYRLFYNYGSVWLGASGDNNWDINVTESDGTHVNGHPPYLFDSGTVSSGSFAPPVTYLTDTSKNWITNQWAYYTVRRVSDNFIGQIISNTSNTLTMRYYTPTGNQVPTWRAGNRYQIHKVLIALDQPGRGRGDLITGDTPPPVWPHQQIEPCYSWNNIHSPGGEHINFTPAGSSSQTLLQGRDYYNDTPMPGYTPYIYPHPLVTGTQPPARATLGSQQHFYKKQKNEPKKARRAKWGKAKENLPNEMAQPDQ